MRASLAILATLGAVLVLAGLDGGAAAPGPGSNGPGLGPNVALRILAPDPARTLPQVRRRLAAAAPSLAVSPGVRRWRADLERARVDPDRDLLAPFSILVISLERSCPPPALLSCRAAIRVIGRLRGEPPTDLQRNLHIAIVAGLRAAGFRSLTVESSPVEDRLAGRVTSSGETLARWRLSRGVLEVATGGLVLHPSASAAIGTAPRAQSMPTEVEIDTNPQTLAAILG